MQKLNTMLVYFVLAAGLFACGGRSPVQSTDPQLSNEADVSAVGGQHELKFDQRLVIKGAELYIDWVSVADSRCPKGVTCVWAGEVSVELAAAGLQEVGEEERPFALQSSSRSQHFWQLRRAKHRLRSSLVSSSPRLPAQAHFGHHQNILHY